MSEQPRFWLKVTPAYVIENFESLLRYVQDYDYTTPEASDSDYNITVDCLCEVANDLIDRLRRLSAEDISSTDCKVDVETELRIYATAMLAEQKRQRLSHEYLLAIIRRLLANNYIPSNLKNKFVKVISNCALRTPIIKNALHFADIQADRFLVATLCAHIADIEFAPNDACAIYEKHGTVMFTQDAVKIAPINLDTLIGHFNKLGNRINLDCGINICELKTKKSIADIETLVDNFPNLFNEFCSVEPSKEKKLNEYTINDGLDVKIIEKSGVRIVCESIDPTFRKVSGKILIDYTTNNINRNQLLEQLKTGDILPAIYQCSGDYEFVLSHQYDTDFVYDDAKHNMTKGSMGAIFHGIYQMGSRWLTECGLIINIMDSAFDRANVNIAEFNMDGKQLKVKILDCREDSKGNLVCNGDVMPSSEQLLDDIEDTAIFTNNATRLITQRFIEYFYPDSETNNDPDFPHVKAHPDAVETLGLLLLKTGNNNSAATFNRLCNMAVATLLMKISGRETDTCIARREYDYLNTIANFAMGKSPISLNFNPADDINDLPNTQVEKHIVDVLRNYKESHTKLKASDMLIGEQFSLVEELVKASNILIDKIDEVELSRIKKHITAKLGVADVYHDINHDRTFYGMESDTLEFKVSCAYPPENRRTGSERKDIDVQCFNILRTICAFLNSSSGGELLIGVNDDGNASGLDYDMELLHKYWLIAEPNIDRLSVYIKNRIDESFVTNDNSASGNAITAGYVSILPEESKEHKYILRIKVAPYPYDVVKIARKYCPEGCNDVFLRSSATSMPLDKDGIRNTRIRKLKALDKNEGNLARILEAIDKRKVVTLHNYHSHKGISNRRIEPHCLTLGNTVIQALDISTRQMRLFKFSRIGEVRIENENWRYANKHCTQRVDIFGMMESKEHPGETITLRMTDFALMLLKEEHPFETDSDMVTVSGNTGPDSKEYPWIVKLVTFHQAGYSRFIKGLPDDIIME